MQIAQRREILEREADGIEDGYVCIALAARCFAAENITELGDCERCVELLNLAFDARLWFELHDYPCIWTAQYVRMQFRLARAVATDGIQMHTGFDHGGCENGGVTFIRGGRRHGVGAASRLRNRPTVPHAQSGEIQRGQIALELQRGAYVGVVQPQLSNAEQV